MGKTLFIFWRKDYPAAFFIFMISAGIVAAELRSFDIEAGNAVATLREFARQARVDVVLDRQNVQGVQTNEVSGLLIPRIALERMLESTPLVFKEDLETGAFAVTRLEVPIADVTIRGSEAPTPESDQQPIKETDMNTKKKNWFKTLAAALTLGIAGGDGTLNAQEDGRQEPIFDLSPFSVAAEEDTGYTATSTLAGTRIRTDLKDLGSAISVYTTEFLEDTGATDAATLLSYTTNAEVGGSQGNFSGAEDRGSGRYFQLDARTNPQQNQRIRGLGSADLTRGYYLTDIAFDSYNTNRVTVSRGPNSLLFGIGSPGGVINNSTKQAIQDEAFTEVKVRFDNHNSLRGEIDINRSLVDGRVAIRIAGLNDHLKYKQEPAWNRDQRLYGALEAVLFENQDSDILGATTFRFNGETGTSKGSPVEIIPPTVAYHGWFEPISPSIEQFTGSAPSPNVVDPSEGGTWKFQETYNPLAINSEGAINTNVQPAWFRIIAAVFGDIGSNTANLGTGDGLQGYQSLLTWNPNLDTLASTGLAGSPGAIAAFGPDASGDTPVARHVEYHANSPYSEPYAIGFAAPTLQNTNVFDYHNHVYSGGVDFVERKFDAKNFVLEQSFFNNRLGVELAYDDQHYESLQDFLFTGGFQDTSVGPYDVFVTIAEYLPDGRPHPNLGRAYSHVGFPQLRFSESDRETFRITAFAELDLTEKDGWLRFLGRHRFTGLYNDYTLDVHTRETKESWVSDDFDVRSAVQGPLLTSFRSRFELAVYTSDSLLGLSSMDDVRLNQIKISRPQPGDTFKALYTDTSSATAERTLRTGNVRMERFLFDENIGQTNIEANAIAWQSYLFDEHIVGLLGLRKDDTSSFARATEAEVGFDSRLDLGQWDPAFTRLSKTPSLVESGDTTTWSVVGRYPEKLFGELPWGMNLQVHYAESENFNPIGLRSNALGQAVGQPTGTTQEYGFQASFADNKFTVKVNWFETLLNNINAGPTVNVGTEAYGLISTYRDAELLDIDFDLQLVTVDGDPANFPIQDYDTFYNVMLNNVPSGFRDLTNPRQEDSDGDGVWDQIDWDNIPNLRSFADRVAEGFEVEMVASPTPGWRILANISQQESFQSNTAAVMAQVVEEYNSNLQNSRAGELVRGATQTSQTRRINDLWLPGSLAGNGLAPIRGARALDNVVSNEQREWRLTAVSTYQFMEGAFKGFGIGGAARWEDEAATGYVFKLDPESGTPIPDVNRPFLDDGLFSGDLWVSYEKMLFDNKVDWKIQLNIRNLFGETDDIPVKTNPDGQVAVIRIPNPRVISLSNSFRF